MNPETETETETETTETEEPQNRMISRFFKEEKTHELNELINQYIVENQTLPFTGVEEDPAQPGQIQVDIVQEFDDKINELFDNSDELIGDYIQAMMMDMMEDPEAMKEVLEAAKAEQQMKAALSGSEDSEN